MKNKAPDRLTLCATAAIEAGMSYGKYMAKYGYNPPVLRQEPEPMDCEEDMIVCPECGKRFYKTNQCRVYCSPECYQKFHDRAAKRRYHTKKAAMAAQEEDEKC